MSHGDTITAIPEDYDIIASTGDVKYAAFASKTQPVWAVQFHPEVHHCITLNSKAHIVGKVLLKTHRHNVQIMGYDVVHKNADSLLAGSQHFYAPHHSP